VAIPGADGLTNKRQAATSASPYPPVHTTKPTTLIVKLAGPGECLAVFATARTERRTMAAEINTAEESLTSDRPSALAAATVTTIISTTPRLSIYQKDFPPDFLGARSILGGS